MYDESKIEEAISVFTFLSLLNGYSPEVWQSLAMCHHRAQEWIPAIQAYTTAIIVKPENPIPYLYSIDCYLTINDKASSEAALHMAKFFVNEENREQTAPLIAHYEKLIQEHS